MPFTRKQALRLIPPKGPSLAIKLMKQTIHGYFREVISRQMDEENEAWEIALDSIDFKESMKALKDAGWPVWYTEYFSNFQAATAKTWANALLNAWSMQTFLFDGNAELLALHQFTGVSNNAGALDPVGRMIRLWADASSGMTQRAELSFSGAPRLYSSDLVDVRAVFGAAFMKDEKKNLLVVNLHSAETTINCESLFSDINAIEQTSAGLAETTDPGQKTVAPAKSITLPAYSITVVSGTATTATLETKHSEPAKIQKRSFTQLSDSDKQSSAVLYDMRGRKSVIKQNIATKACRASAIFILSN